jgi:predicted RNA-binding Zn ribbon-like protein
MVRYSWRRRAEFPLIGNHRCVDFVNTEGRRRAARVDLLAEFPDLVAWLVAARLLEPAEADEALARWGKGAGGARVLAQARRLRACLRDTLERIVRRRPVGASAVAAINAILARQAGRSEVVRARNGFRRRFHLERRAAVDLLVPVAEAAAEFLCEADFSLVRKCSNPPCLRYFYDRSKNHARRWCSMSVCGNRMKVAAHHRRARRRKAKPRSRSFSGSAWS